MRPECTSDIAAEDRGVDGNAEAAAGAVFSGATVASLGLLILLLRRA